MPYECAYHRYPPACHHLVEHTGLALENQLDLGVEVVVDVLPSLADPLSLFSLLMPLDPPRDCARVARGKEGTTSARSYNLATTPRHATHYCIVAAVNFASSSSMMLFLIPPAAAASIISCTLHCLSSAEKR